MESNDFIINVHKRVAIPSIKDDYVWNKENDKHKDKGRDDFEL